MHGYRLTIILKNYNKHIILICWSDKITNPSIFPGVGGPTERNLIKIVVIVLFLKLRNISSDIWFQLPCVQRSDNELFFFSLLPRNVFLLIPISEIMIEASVIWLEQIGPYFDQSAYRSGRSEGTSR